MIRKYLNSEKFYFHKKIVRTHTRQVTGFSGMYERRKLSLNVRESKVARCLRYANSVRRNGRLGVELS